jgi:hypothetical protein
MERIAKVFRDLCTYSTKPASRHRFGKNFLNKIEAFGKEHAVTYLWVSSSPGQSLLESWSLRLRSRRILRARKVRRLWDDKKWELRAWGSIE